MISRYSHKQLNWIDLESPTREEVTVLADEYNLHPLVTAELIATSERAKVDLYDESIYMILHFPIRNRTTGHIEETEVDFILFRNTFITTHYELVDPLHDFAKMFEMGEYLSQNQFGSHAGFLFFLAIRELYKHTLFMVESIGHDIREIERHIFAGHEAKMVAKISTTNRALIDVKQTLRHHKETLKSFSHACKKLYGEDFSYYVSAIEGEYERVEQAAEDNRQTLRDLRETNDSLLTTKTNEAMRKLTVVNIILLPLGLITWIFAMESKYLSLDDPKMLIAVFGGMFIIFLSSITYFKSKKWL